MSAFTDRLDRFVRWFFNSSPTALDIEPVRPPPEPLPQRSPSSRAGRDRPRRARSERNGVTRDSSGRRREPAKAGQARHRPDRADA
jgi:hypothetical protein